MKALDWWLPGLLLLAWTIFSHVVRGFPWMITLLQGGLSMIMLVSGLIVHLVHKKTSKS